MMFPEYVTTSGTYHIHYLEEAATDALKVAIKSKVQYQMCYLSTEPPSLISHSSPVTSSWVRPLSTEPLAGFIFSVVIFLWLRKSAAVLFG